MSQGELIYRRNEGTEQGRKLACSTDSELVFDSEFECGNLECVYKQLERQYVLLVAYDSGTVDYCHWYYFSVVSKHSGVFQFQIVNLMRPEPLVEEGLKPTVSRGGPDNWEKEGEEVGYSETSEFLCYLGNTGHKYYTLSFTIHLNSGELTYFAYCYPYRYIQLQEFLLKIKKDHCSTAKVDMLTQSFLKNDCEYLTISENPSNFSGKKAIVLTARVHPGETQSSYMLQGLVNFLLSHENEAQILRKAFVFYIIPMLNPDGVKRGNYRCCTTGIDLNRTWASPDPAVNPTIHAAKALVKSISGKREIAFFCDFHGHSKKKDVFMYGCSKKRNEIIGSLPYGSTIPSRLGTYNAFFNSAHCHFRMDKYKESTARIALHREFKIRNSFTVECSVYGSTRHFTINDLEQIGKDLARACLVLVSPSIVKDLTERFQERNLPLTIRATSFGKYFKSATPSSPAAQPLGKPKFTSRNKNNSQRKAIPINNIKIHPLGSVSDRFDPLNASPRQTSHINKKSSFMMSSLAITGGIRAQPVESLPVVYTYSPSETTGSPFMTSTFKFDSKFRKCKRNYLPVIFPLPNKCGEKLPVIRNTYRHD